MSLRFLTRRRDRDRSQSAPKESSTPSFARPHTSPAQGRSPVPSEVQIISWDPNHLETSGREVHIRSRAEDLTPTATPVYHAFTRRSATISLSDEVSSTEKMHTRARPRTAPRSQDLHPFFASASNTSRGEDVEVLSPTSSSSHLRGEDGKRSLPSRLSEKARRAKTRSHPITSTYDFNTDDESTASPKTGFSAVHRNASVQSLTSLLSLNHTDAPTPETQEGKGSRMLSRLPSTSRRRRKKAASSADIDLNTSDTEVPARSRSSSFSKLLRGKESKAARGAPPSAWRRDTVDSYSSDNDAGSSSGHGRGSAEATPASPALPAAEHSSPPLTTSQLLKRLGPAPIGLPTTHFYERVTLIQQYITSLGGMREDAFDKLECQTETHMLSLPPPEISQLRLEDAFLEARRRLGISTRCHFDLRSPPLTSPPSVSRALFDSSSLSPSANAGGLGMSLTPAPRKRRSARPDTAPESPGLVGSFSALGLSQQPISRPGEGELLSPQSFSSPRLRRQPSLPQAPPSSFSAGGLRRGSSGDSSSSHNTGSSVRSPLFTALPFGTGMGGAWPFGMEGKNEEADRASVGTCDTVHSEAGEEVNEGVNGEAGGGKRVEGKKGIGESTVAGVEGEMQAAAIW